MIFKKYNQNNIFEIEVEMSSITVYDVASTMFEEEINSMVATDFPSLQFEEDFMECFDNETEKLMTSTKKNKTSILDGNNMFDITEKAYLSIRVFCYVFLEIKMVIFKKEVAE